MQKLSNKFNFGVGLAMILMIIPSFFTLVIKSNHQMNHVHHATKIRPVKTRNAYWTSLPKRPIAWSKLDTFNDSNLSQKVGVIASKTKLSIVEINGDAFKLSNGKYISSKKNQVVSDLAWGIKKTTKTVYATQKSSVFYSPYTTFNPEVLTSISANQVLQIDKKAKTHFGNYDEVILPSGEKGWIDASQTSFENPKMVQLQKLLQQKYQQKNYSIYVKELKHKFTIGVNQNKTLYSASLSKLPILYWTQKRINEGEASLSDSLVYSAQINSFYGSYKPDGTGDLPKVADNKGYSLQDVIDRTAKLSDNVGSNLLSYYETGQFSMEYQNAISKIAGQPWNPKTREASAAMVGRVLEALYDEGGASFDALLHTSFDSVKIRKGVPAQIPVAHKIGDAGDDNHDAAIVFTAQPYILVVETDGASDEQIQQISQEVYEELK